MQKSNELKNVKINALKDERSDPSKIEQSMNLLQQSQNYFLEKYYVEKNENN
jgi:hypothetical protein